MRNWNAEYDSLTEGGPTLHGMSSGQILFLARLWFELGPIIDTEAGQKLMAMARIQAAAAALATARKDKEDAVAAAEKALEDAVAAKG